MIDFAGICALIVMGVSGSGKSTVAEKLAKRIGWAYEDGDNFHPKANIDKMSAGHPLTDADREPWLQAIAADIDKRCKSGAKLVVTCSALKRSYRDILVCGRTDVWFVFLDGSRELIAQRLAARKNHFMPAGLLDSQFATLQKPAADESAIIVSIDAPVDAIVENIIAKLDANSSGDS